MNTISLEGMEFRAPVGCFDEEKIVHPRFVIDVFIGFDAVLPMKTDRLDQTINYQKVYLLIKEIMTQKFNLVERVADAIMLMVLNEFDQANKVSCKIKKMHPALGGQMECVAFSSEMAR
jgi:dihydroneopterin aldolase